MPSDELRGRADEEVRDTEYWGIDFMWTNNYQLIRPSIAE